ncbi:hypothetical protein [Microbacterium sp. TNHR37B]|uniref:hypothetical protein n=1 Tax=Microbacterium sp. TNHR37B TaxID=1775956 RepID=UPI0007B241F0|nr:hypothetical protein [Microbacterium sp. TNHR37B]KZE90850.1 hypothetical protein AVP41_00371 [Microbacterium sp. TNHR37B]
MRFDPLHLVDVLVYLVVLNLTAQFVPGVVAESFAVSLATSVMLKLVLEAVLRLKKVVVARLRAASTTGRRVTSAMMLALILPGSKFVVLWLEDWLFGEAVSLGGFWSVTFLVLGLTASRTLVRRLLAPGVPTV